MVRITVTLDGDVLARARRRALERGTSVNAVVGEYLAQYAGATGAADAIAGFLVLAAGMNASSGDRGGTWTRDELHDRPKLR